MPVGTRLGTFDEDDAPRNWQYLELVSSLMWLSTQTRPDISIAVRAVARYCAAPKLIRWKVALGIIGYVRQTSSFGIACKRGTVAGLSMQVFADADYASKVGDRNSVSGWLVMCGGACVSWFSRTQKYITL